VRSSTNACLLALGLFSKRRLSWYSRLEVVAPKGRERRGSGGEDERGKRGGLQEGIRIEHGTKRHTDFPCHPGRVLKTPTTAGVWCQHQLLKSIPWPQSALTTDPSPETETETKYMIDEGRDRLTCCVTPAPHPPNFAAASSLLTRRRWRGQERPCDESLDLPRPRPMQHLYQDRSASICG
jgi:hypothetical protein